MNLSKKIQTIIAWLFIFAAFLLPLTFSFKTSELFEFPKMLLVYALASLVFALWMTRSIIEKKFLFKRTLLDIPILIFFFSQLLATIFSIHPYTSIFGYYGRFHGGLLSTIAYMIIYWAFVTNGSFKLFKKVILASLASGFLIAIYGILEHFGHSFSCLMITKGKSFGVDCWVQDVKTRVFATLGQPNWLAALMDMLIFFGLYFILIFKKTWQKLGLGLVVLSFVAALIYSGSRSGFLAFALGFFVWLVLVVVNLFKKRGDTKYTYNVIGYKPKYTYLLLIGIILSFGLLVSIIGTPFTPNAYQLIKKGFNPPPVTEEIKLIEAKKPAKPLPGGTDSGVIRAIVWKGAIDVWKRYPIFGSGVETFGYSYYQDRPDAHNLVSEWNFLYNKAHNEFLNFLANSGIVGLVSYLILLVVAFLITLKLFWQDKKPLFALTSLSALLALSVSNFFGFSTVSVSFLMWLTFAALGLVNANNKEKTQESSLQANEATKHISKKAKKRKQMLLNRQSRSKTHQANNLALEWWQYLALVMVALFTLFNLAWIFKTLGADKAYKLGDNLIQAGHYEEGFNLVESAVKRKPHEALFYSKLAYNQARLAVAFAQQRQIKEAETVIQTTLATSDKTLKLNDRQINFYKTRARTLTLLAAAYETLAQVDKDNQDQYLEKSQDMLRLAEETLERARRLAPNEPSLSLDLAKIEDALGNTDRARALFEETIKLKPDYGEAIYTYAQFLEKEKDFKKAKEMYQKLLNFDPNNKTIQEKLNQLDQVTASESGQPSSL